MRILFLGTQMTVGGAQTTLLKLAHSFHERGHHVTAAFLYDKDHLKDTWQAQYVFPIIDLKAWQPKAPLLFPLMISRGILRLVNLLRQQRFDVMMTFTQHSSLLGIPVAWICGVPVRIASNRGRIENIPLWFEQLHGAMVNSRFATSLIVNSHLLREQAMQIEKVRSDKIQVIYNGVEDRFLNPLTNHAQRTQVRQSLGFTDEDKILLSVGRLTHQKGHRYLIEAMPSILSHYPNSKAVLVGDGPMREELEDLAGAVTFLGTRSDVPSLLAAADIFVLPSLSEGMPNALLEAMAFGIPCVVSALGAVEGIILHKHNGMLVPIADASAISEVVCSLLGDAALRSQIATQAQELIRHRFSIQRMIDQHEQLFQQYL